MTRRSFLRTGAKCVAGTTVAGLGGLGYASYVEPGWVDLARVTLTLPRLNSSFGGYKIAQISDIHMDGNWITRARLAEVVTLINEAKPDLVALTGDFVTHSPEQFADDLVASLRGLSSPDGVVAVLGTILHVLPFQCWTCVSLAVPPTAHMSLAPTTATPLSWLALVPTLGLETILHTLPFQCSTSVWLVEPLT